jgi:hypothetical protein
VDVPAADLMRYELDLEWLWISLRARPECLIERILWDLGEARAGMRSWTGLFARRLWIGSNLNRVFEALVTRAGRPPGLVLTTTEGLSTRIEMPGGHQLLPLRDCAHLNSDGLVINHRVIAAGLDRTGGRGRSRTGMPGRPTSRNFYIAEHQRRLNHGEALEGLADETLHLLRWMQEQHPELPQGSVSTIENNIRAAHRQWRVTRPRN